MKKWNYFFISNFSKILRILVVIQFSSYCPTFHTEQISVLNSADGHLTSYYIISVGSAQGLHIHT